MFDSRLAASSRSLELRARASVALARTADSVAHAVRLVERARVVYAAAWDGQLARWYARADLAAAVQRGHRRRAAAAPSTRQRGAAQARRRAHRVGSADAAPEPHDQGRRHTHVWARAEVLSERRVLGRNGEAFTIRELEAGACPGSRTGRCLVFENHSLVRRLWDYPADWLAMSDVAVLALADIGE
jgi:hypothetical protein